MHFLCLATILAVVASAAATPVQAAAPQPSYMNFEDKFDDHQTPAESVGALNAVGTYNGLQYLGLSFANSTLQVVSPKPRSAPNYIFGSLSNRQQIQLIPANGYVKTFNLYSLFYACALDVAGTPQGCTIQVAGRKSFAAGSTTAVKEIVYNPTGGALGATFNFVTFPVKDFSDLVEVTIAVIATKGAQGATLPFFDNVSYRAVFNT